MQATAAGGNIAASGAANIAANRAVLRSVRLIMHPPGVTIAPASHGGRIPMRASKPGESDAIQCGIGAGQTQLDLGPIPLAASMSLRYGV
jgi:hypothetical protein